MNPSTSSNSQNDRLGLLYRLSQTFNSSLDLEEVLNHVMDEVITAIRAERGFVMLHEPAGGLRFAAARGLDQQTISEPQFQVSRSVVEGVAANGQPVLTSDAQSDARFSMRQSIVLQGLRSILCVPLTLKERILGVIYVDNRFQAGVFTPDDLELLGAIASNAAIAIENARLYQVAVEKGRMERELQVAREMQSSLLPDHTPSQAGWEFAARWLPARQVAGDFYDFIRLSDQHLGLVIADVADKGMPAALFMALARSFVRASLHHARSPADAIHHANRLICADAKDGMFVTLFYAQLDTASGDLVYVNAGHNPPLHYSRREDRLRALERTGIALGVLNDGEYQQATTRLEPGDMLVLYTDGITEAHSENGDMFGEERLLALLLEQQGDQAETVAQALLEAGKQFSGSDLAPNDDLTLVVVRRRL